MILGGNLSTRSVGPCFPTIVTNARGTVLTLSCEHPAYQQYVVDNANELDIRSAWEHAYPQHLPLSYLDEEDRENPAFWDQFSSELRYRGGSFDQAARTIERQISICQSVHVSVVFQESSD